VGFNLKIQSYSEDTTIDAFFWGPTSWLVGQNNSLWWVFASIALQQECILIPFWNYPVSFFLRSSWFLLGMDFTSSSIISLCIVLSCICGTARHSKVSKDTGLQSSNIQLRWWIFLCLIRSTLLLLILAIMYFNASKPHGPGNCNQIQLLLLQHFKLIRTQLFQVAIILLGYALKPVVFHFSVGRL